MHNTLYEPEYSVHETTEPASQATAFFRGKLDSADADKVRDCHDSGQVDWTLA